MKPVSPVLPGSEEIDVTFGKRQPQYQPLPAFYLERDDCPVLTRWRLDDEERAKVAAGADIVLTLLRFRDDEGNPNLLTPSHLQVCLPDEMPLFVEEPK